jgi:recombination protein U
MMTLRGKELEKIINSVNLQYRKQGLALIYNLPLPVTITTRGPIPMTTPVDYIGSIGPNGKAIAFDAKETLSCTSFPLRNIHDHQLNFLSIFEKTGGKAGFLIWFKNIDEDKAFWVPAKFIKEFIQNEVRKSIPYKKFSPTWKVPLQDYLQLIPQSS